MLLCFLIGSSCHTKGCDSMNIKLLTEHHLEFICLTGGCTGLSESTLVKMPHCWKSHVMAQILIMLDGYNKGTNPWNSLISAFRVKSGNFGHQACTGPGIFVRGGVQVCLTKKSFDNVFLVFSLFYRSQMVNFKEVYHFFCKVPEGVQHFPGGGGPTFSRGVKLYRNPYNL